MSSWKSSCEVTAREFVRYWRNARSAGEVLVHAQEENAQEKSAQDINAQEESALDMNGNGGCGLNSV